jgi:succinylglutamate desuccinylase
MTEDIIELKGETPGPSSIILVGVHGDETCGVLTLEKIIPDLKIECGRVFLAFANPRAITAGVRFTEMNLNRAFKPDKLISEKERGSYEYKRAQFLKIYLEQADVLLDVHASYNPKSQKFIIAENNALALMKYLPFDIIVSGFDQVEPGGTDYYMNSIGRIGICVECGYLGDQSSVKVAEESIFSFLAARGHIKKPLIVSKQKRIRIYKLFLSKTDSFKLAKDFADFEEVSAQQLIGRDGPEEVRAPKEGIILFASNVYKPGSEAFLLGEYEKTR